MTSLPLTQSAGFFRKEVPEWGTDKPKESVPLWSAKTPNWHQSGEPITQYYQLTQLKKSDVRLNDQLLPKPQESLIGDSMIHLPFPAEHPYSSHIPRLKMFPSFSTTAEEPKRGIDALMSQPISSETPSANFDITVINKSKGAGDRHELQKLPLESLKRGLSWHGEQRFHHGVKYLGDKQDYYPIPPSLIAPNLQPRGGTSQSISAQTANVTRNLERQQWKTTYENNHTGLGPVNQYQLDNLTNKVEHKIASHGHEDDNIYPWFINSVDQARPQQGRIAKHQNPNYGIFLERGAAQPETAYIRPLTLGEKEEDRLLNGTDYANLPASRETTKDMQWNEWDLKNRPQDRFSALVERQMRNVPDPVPFHDHANLKTDGSAGVTYSIDLATQHHDTIQQMEAKNRWEQLEAMKPSHDIAELERKLKLCTTTEQPALFYGHEGKFNEERAGLYKTSYDPYKLATTLDKDPAKLTMRNTTYSAQNALNLTTDLNSDVDILRGNNHSDPTKVALLSERPDIYEVFEPFKRDRMVREQQIQPTISNSRVRVQESAVLNKESTMGSDYNTKKFLQENSINALARAEPLSLMSQENLNLENSRVNSIKQVKFNERVTVGEGAGDSPLLISSAFIENPKQVIYTPRIGGPSKLHKVPPQIGKLRSSDFTNGQDDSVYKSMQRSSEMFRPTTTNSPRSQKSPDYLSSLTDLEKTFLSQKNLHSSQNLFASKASNLGIGSNQYNRLKSSCGDQMLRGSAFEMTADKSRFNWEPGCGTPRPQTTLLKLQNSFSKTAAHKALQDQYPERNPNLIENEDKGRKHEFNSLNAQVLRGTLINA